jgi:hypothetical protein
VGFLNKQIAIGFFVALFATFGGLFLYLEYFSNYSFEATLELVKKEKLYSKVIALAAIPNLFVFFVYIKKKQDLRARGVLLATILIAITSLILKFY